MGNLGQVAGGLLIRLVCTQSPTICFPFLSYTSLRQLLICFEASAYQRFFVQISPFPFFLFFTTETLEIFLHSDSFFLKIFIAGKRREMYVRVWELLKQEGASCKPLAFFCPLFVLCFKYRIGLVGAEGGQGEA